MDICWIFGEVSFWWSNKNSIWSEWNDLLLIGKKFLSIYKYYYFLEVYLIYYMNVWIIFWYVFCVFLGFLVVILLYFFIVLIFFRILIYFKSYFCEFFGFYFVMINGVYFDVIVFSSFFKGDCWEGLVLLDYI